MGKGLFLVALSQFVDGVEHLLAIDFMRFEAVADAAQQGDRELPSEVFAEFLEATEEDRSIIGIDVEKFTGEKFEAKQFE